MRNWIGLVVAFLCLTVGIIVLFQSVVLVSHNGLTLAAGAVLAASGLLMLFSVFLVWVVFRARQRQLSLEAA